MYGGRSLWAWQQSPIVIEDACWPLHDWHAPAVTARSVSLLKPPTLRHPAHLIQFILYTSCEQSRTWCVYIAGIF